MFSRSYSLALIDFLSLAPCPEPRARTPAPADGAPDATAEAQHRILAGEESEEPLPADIPTARSAFLVLIPQEVPEAQPEARTRGGVAAGGCVGGLCGA